MISAIVAAMPVTAFASRLVSEGVLFIALHSAHQRHYSATLFLPVGRGR
jgi:hypothetical protein